MSEAEYQQEFECSFAAAVRERAEAESAALVIAPSTRASESSRHRDAASLGPTSAPVGAVVSIA